MMFSKAEILGKSLQSRAAVRDFLDIINDK
ncbi:hypothetical protein C3B55_00343 [Candidatus Pseudomonas adelgestsugas]|uniref:Uncharacterized protein n=1 Tax=Candidatus Pseudomonas adelgestsugas TaxID=1302376 RepID=A0ABX5R813_9PSED|nr:hypothetical protein C3B55_00343 [Candidatus Pseudomonas adelgestsugas]